MEKLYTVSEAAVLLERHPRYLTTAIQRGVLHARKVGSFWVMTDRDLDEYRAQHMRLAPYVRREKSA